MISYSHDVVTRFKRERDEARAARDAALARVAELEAVVGADPNVADRAQAWSERDALEARYRELEQAGEALRGRLAEAEDRRLTVEARLETLERLLAERGGERPTEPHFPPHPGDDRT